MTEMRRTSTNRRRRLRYQSVKAIVKRVQKRMRKLARKPVRSRP
jgi:hypothetical protein